jgi:hypothetical protein
VRRLCLLVAIFCAADALADTLPIPPVPPLTPPPGAAAPVPDANLSGPDAFVTPPSVSLKLYRARPYDPGLGFAPGSRYQSTEDRKPIQTPGLSFSVPLQ